MWVYQGGSCFHEVTRVLGSDPSVVAFILQAHVWVFLVGEKAKRFSAVTAGGAGVDNLLVANVAEDATRRCR